MLLSVYCFISVAMSAIASRIREHRDAGADHVCIQPIPVGAPFGRIDLGAVREQIGAAKALQGNIDPAVLLAGPDATRAAAADLLARVPSLGHIVNLGHGIQPGTPLESVQALVDVVHGESDDSSLGSVAT